MTNTYVRHDVNDVNRRILTDPVAFALEEEARYDAQVEAAASFVAKQSDGCRFVWQCGPSSVGKTTTAHKLCQALRARGLRAEIVSIDDFYRGVAKAPLLPDGTYDYESPLALDLERLHDCITELHKAGHTRLPIYDFPAGRPSDDVRELKVDGKTVVIFEGIHAFSPVVTVPVEQEGIRPVRLFVNTRSRFTRGDEVLLCRRDIRLSRRLLRDERERASSFENTMNMWAGVLRGDEQYILPYNDTADVVVDTTMAYEPCVLKPLIEARLHTLDGTAYEQKAQQFKAAYADFEPIGTEILPKGAVLREFVG